MWKDTSAFLFWLFIVVIMAIVMSFVWNWIYVPADTFSATNVRSLSARANEQYESLEASKLAVTNIERTMRGFIELYGEDRSKWPQGKRFEYEQLLPQRENRVNAYNQQCAAFRAFWQDEWRDAPAPDDIPTSCDMITD